jgi:hypothetical protein
VDRVRSQGTRCKVCRLRPELRAHVDRALTGDESVDPPVRRASPAEIAAVLTRHGIPITGRALQRHRADHLRPEQIAALRIAAESWTGRPVGVSARALAAAVVGSPSLAPFMERAVDEVRLEVTALDAAAALTTQLMKTICDAARERYTRGGTLSTAEGRFMVQGGMMLAALVRARAALLSGRPEASTIARGQIQRARVLLAAPPPQPFDLPVIPDEQTSCPVIPIRSLRAEETEAPRVVAAVG